MTQQRLRVNIRRSQLFGGHSLSPWPEGPLQSVGLGVRTLEADSIMNVVGDPEVSFPSLGPLVVLHYPPNSNLHREIEQRMRNRGFI